MGDLTASSHEREVLTEEEYDAFQREADSLDQTLLLQLGSEACTRCPAFREAISELKGGYKFRWIYCDAHHQDTDLPELFSIKQLPAFVLYSPGGSGPLVFINASPEQLRAEVKRGCRPTFTIDADF